MNKNIKSISILAFGAFILMSGTCSKTQPLAEDPCSVTYEFDYNSTNWINQDHANKNYPIKIDLGNREMDDITLTTISKYTLPGDYNYYVMWKHHSINKTTNKWGSLYNCNGDLLCNNIVVNQSSDLTNYSTCENPLSPQNIDYNNPDRTWTINNTPQLNNNSCFANFLQYWNDPVLLNRKNATLNNYPSANYQLKSIDFTIPDMHQPGGTIFVFGYVNMNVNNPSGADEWYEWYDCNGTLLDQNNGDYSYPNSNNTHLLTKDRRSSRWKRSWYYPF